MLGERERERQIERERERAEICSAERRNVSAKMFCVSVSVSVCGYERRMMIPTSQSYLIYLSGLA